VTSDASVETFSARRADVTGERIYRHDVIARATHWLWALAILVLVMSGLQIFNAAPYLDASDKSNPARRVLAFDARQVDGRPVGTTTVFGHTFNTTHLLGYTDDGMGAEDGRAFPGWATLPGPQDLADGRRWHLFFAWAMFIAWATYLLSAGLRGKLRDLVMRPADFAKLLPMQLYYLRLRKEPPPHGTYNPLQKLTYNVVLFVMFPLIIITGLALSPGVDSAVPWLTPLLGGRQFARTWHFTLMALLIGYFGTHLVLVLSTGVWNNMRSMITGWFVLGEHDGVGP
jgi:thiosulfate reductase cytochrome b subunit